MRHAVHLRVHSHGQSGVSVLQSIVRVSYASREAVVALGENAAIADSDCADLGGGVFGPASKVRGNHQESLIPMLRRLGWLEVVQ